MSSNKEATRSAYELDGIKLSREYRKSPEARRIVYRLEKVLSAIRDDVNEETVSHLAYAIGMLDDLSEY